MSVCYTSQNCEAVTSDAFYDTLIEAGARYAWYFHYMPVGSDADQNLLLSRSSGSMYRTIREKRDGKNGKPIFTVDFQNDAEFVGGCIAGGRNYFHINSEGDAEPCVFIHYSDSNIRQKSIKECLQSPLFYEYYKGQPFNNNMLRPCPMLENPAALRRIVSQTGAKSTNFLAPESAETLCAKCDAYAAAWRLPPSAFGRRKAASGPLPSIIGTPRRAKRTARCKSCKTCPCLRKNKENIK